MFSLYHSSQKQFIILSRAVLVASNLAWSMHICLKLYIGHFRLVSALTSPSICVSRQLFLVHYHFSFYSVNHEQITSNFSCKYHGAANAKIVEHWSNLGQYFPKKERKSRYKSNFQCVSLRRTNCLLMNVSRYVSRKHALRFGFLITLETLSFFSLKSSLEFIIIPPHNMQKTRRSKERTNMDLHDNICRGSPIQFLTLPDRA